MQKPVLTIFYQFNPWQASLGGIQTIIRSFIKYAPADIEIRLVGTGVGKKAMPSGQWHRATFAGRELLFFPLFDIQEDNVRKLIPTSLRYTLALFRHDLSSDFMHFHRMEPAIAAFRWAGNKLLYIHNDMHQKVKASKDRQSFLWQRFPWLYFALERLLLRQFGTVLSCNSETTEFYHKQYPAFADRIFHVRNAVDDEVFYPISAAERTARRESLAQRLTLPKRTRFFLFAGRLHPQKDPLLLLQSLAALKDSRAHLLIAGAGELTQAVKAEMARLNLSSQVTLLGTVDQFQLSQLYHAAEAFVLSSVYEGLPIVALESLACGSPVITTRAGDTPNVLTPNSGIVCDERSAEAIAGAMAQLLNHPERYPQSACIQAVKPYRGKTVIRKIYADMLAQWAQQTGQNSSEQQFMLSPK